MEKTDHIIDDLDELSQQIYREASSMSVFCSAHPLSCLRTRLRSRGVISASDLEKVETGRIVIVTGLMVMVHTPPTKSGKRVMFITMEDETGLMDVIAFDKIQNKYAGVILTSQVLSVKGRLQRQGAAEKPLSIIMERVVVPWSGSLVKLLLRKWQDFLT